MNIFILNAEDITGTISLLSTSNDLDSLKKLACHYIQAHINKDFNLSLGQDILIAEKLEEYIHVFNDYDNAIDYWNYNLHLLTKNSLYQKFSIVKYQSANIANIWIGPPTVINNTSPHLISNMNASTIPTYTFVGLGSQSTFNFPTFEAIKDKENNLNTHSGAYCRGTHKEYNEYAVPDKDDGTYLCQQCRILGDLD